MTDEYALRKGFQKLLNSKQENQYSKTAGKTGKASKLSVFLEVAEQKPA